MGCDIHAYLEYFDTEASKPWVDVFSHDIQFFRNYMLFNALACVRGFGGGFAPKGLPTIPDVGHAVFNKYYLKIIENDLVETTHPACSCVNAISQKKAEEYIYDYKLFVKQVDGNKYIKNPFWHSASYLNKKELIEVRRMYLLDTIEDDCTYKGNKRKDVIKKLENTDEYELMTLSFPDLECAPLNATIASMIAIENSGNYKSRLVFWFDS